MFLVTFEFSETMTNELAGEFGGNVYAPGAIMFEKPSEVGELARYLCKLEIPFEVQPD